MDICVSKADMIGQCEMCSEPTTGSLDCDRDRVVGDDDLFTVKLTCVNCGDEHEYIIEPTVDGYLIADKD